VTNDLLLGHQSYQRYSELPTFLPSAVRKTASHKPNLGMPGHLQHPHNDTWAWSPYVHQWWIRDLHDEWYGHQWLQHWVATCWLEHDCCRWQSVWIDDGGRVRASQRPWDCHSGANLLCKIRIWIGYLGLPQEKIQLNGWEEPQSRQWWDHHLCCSWVRTCNICCYLPRRREGWICQELRNLVCLVKVWVTRKDSSQHYEWNWLEVCERKGSNEKEPNSGQGTQKSIDRKRPFAATVDRIHNREEEGSFGEKVNQLVRRGDYRRQ